MAELQVHSIAPNVEHSIDYDGDSFVLRCDGGTWMLNDDTGQLVAHIGRRKRWTAALADAIDSLIERTDEA